ncbi:MAG: cofactor-independent phosphoglycerate mutase [Candidatus Omnitrophica bacterium]|nr:cofactor-independent phosphoglycerate mutase [Candidatus Omnitrophota bacterium]
MKYIVLVGDGMADRPLKEFDDKTPLEVARMPNMNYIAKEGTVGCTVTVPQGLSPASDVANMALLGYDPRKYYSGRGPLEAANMGVVLKENDVAFRCNVVTVSDDKMADYSAGHITNKEAHVIIDFVNKRLGSEAIRFYPGVSYRHLAVINSKKAKLKKEDLINAICTPPHDILGKPIARYLPRGAASGFLTDLMLKSQDILASHDVNRVRVDLKENPANMIWLWGQGIKPTMPLFSKKYNLKGSIISAVDLIKGMGKIIDLEPIDVPGATGYYDTDYQAKADYALNSLKKKDFVFIHVEAPDEAGHNGDVRQKLLAIENFDKMVVGTVLNHFKETKEDFRVLVVPDHATPISVRTHTNDPVPFAMYGAGIKKDSIKSYSEVEAKKSKLFIEDGYKLMDRFLKE